jgi:hypothetical protein
MAKSKGRGKSSTRTKRPARNIDPGTDTANAIPPGATREAFDRPLNPAGGAPGSGAGPRHAAGDPGDDEESLGRDPADHTLAEPPVQDETDPLEEGPPFAGPSGGAVGGTPAESRTKGGKTHHGIAPGASHRGDSTIGADPDYDPD